MFGITAPWRLMKKLEMVKRFNAIMLEKISFRNFRKLGPLHFHILNDKSYFVSQQQS